MKCIHMNRWSLGFCLLAFELNSTVGTALAETKPTPNKHQLDLGGMSGLGMTLAAKLGGQFGGVLTDLQTSGAVELDVGWILPLPEPMDRSLELSLSGVYTEAIAKGTVESDGRLPGDGRAEYELVQRQAVVNFGLRYRLPLTGDFRPYLGLAARIWMVQTTQTGSVSAAEFPGNHIEENTDIGVHSVLGCEWLLGPGALLAEIQPNYGLSNRRIRHDAQLGGLATFVGYRLFL